MKTNDESLMFRAYLAAEKATPRKQIKKEESLMLRALKFSERKTSPQ